MERLVRFSLYGQDFSFFSEASEEDTEKIVSLVKEEVESQGREVRGKVLSSRLAILGGLRIAARYMELRREFDDYRAGQEARIERLADSLLPVIEGEGF